jgi:hypothetical protein
MESLKAVIGSRPLADLPGAPRAALWLRVSPDIAAPGQ